MTTPADQSAEVRALAAYIKAGKLVSGKMADEIAAMLLWLLEQRDEAQLESDHQRKCASEWFDRFQRAEAERDEARAALAACKQDGRTNAEIAHQVRLLYQVCSSPAAAQILDAADRAMQSHKAEGTQ